SQATIALRPLLLPTSPSLYLFFFYCTGDHRDLHSFPTRRSSDLNAVPLRRFVPFDAASARRRRSGGRRGRDGPSDRGARQARARSEEHTSELQSRGHLVCRLLLEKKKKHNAVRPAVIVGPDHYDD